MKDRPSTLEIAFRKRDGRVGIESLKTGHVDVFP
jgi:hypothetical protein